MKYDEPLVGVLFQVVFHAYLAWSHSDSKPLQRFCDDLKGRSGDLRTKQSEVIKLAE